MLVSKIKAVLVAVVAATALVLGGSQVAHQPARAAAPLPESAGADDPAPKRSPADELVLARARELLLKEELRKKDQKILSLTAKLEVADLEGIIYRDQLKQKGREIERLKLAAGARELLLKELVREKDKEIEKLRQDVERAKGKK